MFNSELLCHRVGQFYYIGDNVEVRSFPKGKFAVVQPLLGMFFVHLCYDKWVLSVRFSIAFHVSEAAAHKSLKKALDTPGGTIA